MADIKKVVISVTTTGSAGSATGDALSSEVVNGFVIGAYVNYHASAPGATTDVLLQTADPAITMTTISNNATDGYYSTLKNIVDTAAAAVSGVYTYYPVSGHLKVSVTGCNALTAAVVVTYFVAPN